MMKLRIMRSTGLAGLPKRQMIAQLESQHRRNKAPERLRVYDDCMFQAPLEKSFGIKGSITNRQRIYHMLLTLLLLQRAAVFFQIVWIEIWQPVLRVWSKA